MDEKKDYKDSLNLPKTEFPMKAGLATMEPKILDQWADIYKKIRAARKGAPRYVLHDGPPYANGDIHMGHALNKVLKDMIVKIKTMQGFDAPYVPGWDCHGLPIEHQVDKKLGKKKGEVSRQEKRQLCRDYAAGFIERQKESFRKIGIFGEWENPYLTMDYRYEADTVRELAKFMDNGSLFQGLKPVHWCTSCRTALAEAEVEYADHTSPSVYVKFVLEDGDAQKLGLPAGEQAAVVIWTTTPWTIPANRAVCVHPGYEYTAARVNGGIVIVASELAEKVLATLGTTQVEVVARLKGNAMEGIKTKHPLYGHVSPVILGEHVTLEAGTGAVHTAPGHGQEDYIVGQKYGLEVYNPVQDNGTFIEELGFFGGKRVPQVNPEVMEKLKELGMLMHSENISHSYPHCWRCKNPVIFRATAQWFISMEKNGLREKALSEINATKWVPAWGKERIYGMVQNRPDWCVSRQRAWGVPITVLHCESCRTPMVDGDAARMVADEMEKHGSDVWFEKSASEFAAGKKCQKCGGDQFRKEEDILDVWFDSGVSHAAVLKRREALKWPADLYLEGSDQHRGWFQSSLLASVGTTGKAPYGSVLTHGYVVDAKGRKMSKSDGNQMFPEDVVKNYGAEILRLWVSSENYMEEVRVSDEILKRLSEAYRKIRNTFRFMLGNLYDFDPVANRTPFAEMEEIDRYILNRAAAMQNNVLAAFGRHEYHVFYHAVYSFCVVDLSSFYLDIVKDRVYTFPPRSKGRRSAQTVMYDISQLMVRLMAPVLSFTAEEVWQTIPGNPAGSTVHTQKFLDAAQFDIPGDMMLNWDRLWDIRKDALKALEDKRRDKEIGHSLDAKLVVTASGKDFALLEKHLDELPFIFIVSQVELSEKPSGETEMTVAKADGAKCERCWNYTVDIGSNATHPQTCGRCAKHLAEFA